MAFVYRLDQPPQNCGEYIKVLGSSLYHWVAYKGEFLMGTGVPERWMDQGSLFGEGGELRWLKNGDMYNTLLFTQRPVEGLTPVDGSWSIVEERFCLWDLEDRKISPLFKRYPVGMSKGWLRAVLYLRNGLVVFVSPREIIKEE